MPDNGNKIDLEKLRRMMTASGVTRLFAKALAPNDNSKNQPYLGGDFSILNILPASNPEPASSGSHGSPIFKAALELAWLDDEGHAHRAPGAKLILYPQYPEVRLSGYLKGCSAGPSDVLGTTREPGRVLFLGVRDDRRTIGYAAKADTALAREFLSLPALERIGVFSIVPLGLEPGAADDRSVLLRELCRIARRGWIPATRLDQHGAGKKCRGPNCGGYTLEAELGVTPNGRAEPDFRGWEVKQYGVDDFASGRAGPVTLMTPEPTGGVYRSDGVLTFVERYGYQDTRGRAGRLNFGGRHVFERPAPRTRLTLMLDGYDAGSGRITDPSGGIVLIDQRDVRAAEWSYSSLLAHWTRKHARAVYVPSQSRENGETQEYCYSSEVHLGVGTDFLRLLNAIAAGCVYYDPGIKVEDYPERPRIKRRSQFRIAVGDLPSLYERFEPADACADALRGSSERGAAAD